jgi:beta-lactamase regulating signal transducer with metallopeptidase domain
MNLPSHLLSPEAMRLIALTLLHFLWQGTALAMVAYVGMQVCRSASTRYVIAVAMLVIMAAAPAVTLLALIEQNGAADHEQSEFGGVFPQVMSIGLAHANTKAIEPDSQGVPSYFLWMVEMWFLGVMAFSLRSAGGMLLVERLRSKESKAVSGELLGLCRDLQKKMGVNRLVNFYECIRLEAPAVAGWLRPAVLLPICTLTGLNQEQLSSVIAHEIAHIKRFDPLVNLFQVGVETLMFYHPGVWWLNKRIREERENCCDDMAVAVCGSPLMYAHALARLAESQTSPRLILAANSRPLAARVARLLGVGKKPDGLRGADLSLGLLCLSAALVASGAFLGVARVAHAQMADAIAPTSLAQKAQSVSRSITEALTHDIASSVALNVENAVSRRLESRVSALHAALEAGQLSLRSNVSTPMAMPSPMSQAPTSSGQSGSSSYIDGLKSAGLENLTVDEIIGLKVQGVTPEYVKAMRELGMHLDAGAMIGMKIQGITPEYVREMRSATGQSLDSDDLIGMKIQGISPEYVKEIHGLGLKADSSDLIGLKVQGITPEYVQEMRKLEGDLDTGDLIGMKVQGVTPEYVKAINELGLHPDAGELIGMKVQGIDAEYLKKMQAAGFKLDVDDAIGAKVMGVTPEFIEKARSHGFKDLTMHQLLGLKQAGVLDEAKQ